MSAVWKWRLYLYGNSPGCQPFIDETVQRIRKIFWWCVWKGSHELNLSEATVWCVWKHLILQVTVSAGFKNWTTNASKTNCFSFKKKWKNLAWQHCLYLVMRRHITWMAVTCHYGHVWSSQNECQVIECEGTFGKWLYFVPLYITKFVDTSFYRKINQLEHLSVHVNYMTYVSILWSYANVIIQEDEAPLHFHLEL